MKPPAPAPLVMHTLTGLVDYVKSGLDEGVNPEDLAVHVVGHDRVELVSRLDRDTQTRRTFAQVRLPEFEEFKYSYFHDVEAFVIRLQMGFVQDETTAELLRLVGNIRDETVSNTADDGVSQTVTVKAGAHLVTNKKVPNPVHLRPWRTFREIEQPQSAFVFRLRKGDPLPGCALFASDGDMWRLTAIESIRHWINEQLDGQVHVIA